MADPFVPEIPELPKELTEQKCAQCGKTMIYHSVTPDGANLNCDDVLDPDHPDPNRALRAARTVIANMKNHWLPAFAAWNRQSLAYMADQAKDAVGARDREILRWSDAERMRQLEEARQAPVAVEVIDEDDPGEEDTNPGAPLPVPPAPPRPPPTPPPRKMPPGGMPNPPVTLTGPPPIGRPPAPPAPPRGGDGAGNGKLPPPSDDDEDDELRRTHQMPVVRPAPPQDQAAGDGCMNPKRSDTSQPCDRPVTRRHTFPKRGGGEVEIRCCADSECPSVLWRQYMDVLQPEDPAMTKYPRDAFHMALQAP